MGRTMSRPTTEKRIQEFMLAGGKQKPLPKQYEVYIAVDNIMYGTNIDWLSEKKIIEGYDQVWRFVRDDQKIIIATNSKLVTLDYAKWFAVAIHQGNIRTISVDLAFLNDGETK